MRKVASKTKIAMLCVKCGHNSGHTTIVDYRIKMGRTVIGNEIMVGLSVPKLVCDSCGTGYFDEDYIEQRRRDILNKLSGK